MTAIEQPPASADRAGDGTGDDFESLARAVDEARQAVGELPDEARDAAENLMKAIEGFHRPGLVQIVRTLREDPRGKELLFELVDAAEVRALFALHGIIRADPMTRAQAALDSVRPYLQSHGGDVELVEIDGSTAVVRLQGSCNGCSMSAVTLREGVEEALVSGVDEISGIRVLENEATTVFIPVDSIGRKPASTSSRTAGDATGAPDGGGSGSPGPGWTAGPPAASVAEGELGRFDVGDDSYVLTKVDNRIAVFRNECVHQGLSLDGGMLSEGVITCPWHGFTFDASSGECISAPGAQLQQVPARIDDGVLWIRTGQT